MARRQVSQQVTLYLRTPVCVFFHAEKILDDDGTFVYELTIRNWSRYLHMILDDSVDPDINNIDIGISNIFGLRIPTEDGLDLIREFYDLSMRYFARIALCINDESKDFLDALDIPTVDAQDHGIGINDLHPYGKKCSYHFNRYENCSKDITSSLRNFCYEFEMDK